MEKRSLKFTTHSEIKYTCNLCHGKGNLAMGDICPRCKGKGFKSKHVKPGKYHEHKCGICSGTGHNPFNKTECSNCQGTGNIIINVESHEYLWNYS